MPTASHLIDSEEKRKHAAAATANHTSTGEDGMPFHSVLADRSNTRTYSFGDAVLAGWADDGGMLWLPIPKLSQATLRHGQTCRTSALRGPAQAICAPRRCRHFACRH